MTRLLFAEGSSPATKRKMGGVLGVSFSSGVRVLSGPLSR